MSDNYPYDRQYWLVSVSFPVEHLPRMDGILAEVERLAGTRGGVPGQRCRPADGFVGRPGYDTFGCSIAFEAGDANTDGFIRLVGSKMADLGVTFQHDPAEVFGPDEPDEDAEPAFRC